MFARGCCVLEISEAIQSMSLIRRTLLGALFVVIACPDAGAAGAMKLLSRGLPVFSSSGIASRADDADYDSYWRSSGTPATLTFDLSSVNPVNRRQILLVWYNDPTYAYDHALIKLVGYNNPGSYTVEVNAGSGGKSPPQSGWRVVATISDNTLHSREHLIDFAGYSWVRLNFTSADGSPGNTDIAVNVDIYDASLGAEDGWLFVGDSITANGMGHETSQGATEGFGKLIEGLIGETPAQENAGMPGWATTTVMPYFQGWVNSFPGKYVTINLGTNDAAYNLAPSQYFANMSMLVREVLAAGKVPVIPTIPWSRDSWHAQRIPPLNDEIRRLYKEFPSIVPGPDLFAYFNLHQDYIAPDGVHPTGAGYSALRKIWATTAVQSIYQRK